jgi:hypothetical protein
MGFFSDIFEGIKNTASNIWSGAKNVAGTLYGLAKKPIDFLSGAADVVSKIPVLGTALSPGIAAVKGVKSVLDQGQTIADVAKQIGLKSGGMVSKRMFQKGE